MITGSQVEQLQMRGRDPVATLKDGSALLTALLLAFSALALMLCVLGAAPLAYASAPPVDARVTSDLAVQLYPAIDGTRFVWQDMRNGNSDIYAYDLSTKSELRLTTNPDDQWMPQISANRVVWIDWRNALPDVYAYDFGTHLESRITTGSYEVDTCAIDGSKLVYGRWDSTYDHNLYALDSRTGAFRWKYATDGGLASSPCFWQDRVFVGSEDRLLYCVNAQSGRIVWTCPTQGCVRSSPRVEYNHVFFGSDDHRLYAVNVQSGRVAWKVDVEGPVRSRPVAPVARTTTVPAGKIPTRRHRQS